MSSLQKFHRRTQPFVVNTLHTGTVSITGTTIVGEILTATNNIVDVDGLGTFAYQWNRSGSIISGATSSTYTTVSADIGTTITVTITYTDGKGFIETETSAATGTITVAPPVLGTGNNTKGYYLGLAGDGTSYLYVAPKSTTLVECFWGSAGTTRGTISTTNGIANTNTLAGFGQAAHPAAYHCKNLTTGGYNTWYLPAKDELKNLLMNSFKTPFATDNSFTPYRYAWSSTESSATDAWFSDYGGSPYAVGKSYAVSDARAVRRSTI